MKKTATLIKMVSMLWVFVSFTLSVAASNVFH